MDSMFYGADKITDASAIDNWNLTNVTSFKNMFRNVSVKPNFTNPSGTFDSNGTFIPNI